MNWVYLYYWLCVQPDLMRKFGLRYIQFLPKFEKCFISMEFGRLNKKNTSSRLLGVEILKYFLAQRVIVRKSSFAHSIYKKSKLSRYYKISVRGRNLFLFLKYSFEQLFPFCRAYGFAYKPYINSNEHISFAIHNIRTLLNLVLPVGGNIPPPKFVDIKFLFKTNGYYSFLLFGAFGFPFRLPPEFSAKFFRISKSRKNLNKFRRVRKEARMLLINQAKK